MITKINCKAQVYKLYYEEEINCDIYQSFRLQRRNAQDFVFEDWFTQWQTCYTSVIQPYN